MPTLQELLIDIPDRQLMEDTLVSRALADIDRQTQQRQEQLFGRGLGLSTLQGEIARERNDAIIQARRDAFLASQQARQAALAQAAQYDLGRQQLAQRAGEARRAGATQQRGQWMQAGAGLGSAALGTAGRIWGEDIKKSLKGILGDRTAPTSTSGADMPYGRQDYEIAPLAAPAIPEAQIQAPVIDYMGEDLGGPGLEALAMPPLDVDDYWGAGVGDLDLWQNYGGLEDLLGFGEDPYGPHGWF